MTKKEDKLREVDVSKIDLDQLKKLTTENPGVIQYPHTRGGQSFTPTKSGAIKSRAYKVMDEQIGMQMDNIMEQIKVLANQVETLKERRKVSESIYSCQMNFEPVVGNSYYLYGTPKGDILSMISPDDWGERNMQEKELTFKAHAKLLADCTWEVLESA